MPDDAAPRAAVIVAMPDDIDYGRSDQAFDQRYAATCRAQLRLVIPPAGPVRRILEVTGLDQRFQLYPTASHAALIPLPRPARGAEPGDPGQADRR